MMASKVPLSKEENDILYRNAKKIKNDEEKLHGEEWPMLGSEGVYQKAPGTSFVEKLKGSSQSERMMEEPVIDSEDSLSENDDQEPICLSNKEDYCNALTGGPWMLFDHYLTVRPWEPQFPGFFLDGEEQYLEYEGLHWLCTGCGLYGHKIEDCKVATTKMVSGSQVGGGVSGSSSEQSSALGKDLDITEEWRVVHRPRRQKKTGKEAKQGEVRRKEEGSRFGVLAEESIGGMEELIVTDHVAVRDVAVEVNTPRNPTSVKQMREKKSETKKKMRKEQLQVREKGVQKQSKQDLRKEKRARDVAQGEQQTKGILSLTGREGDLQDKGVLQGKGELQSFDKEERGQRSAGGPTFEKDDNPILGPDMGPVLGPVKGPDLEHIARGCVDVGETETQSGLPGVGGPKGKFWAASSSVEADLDLVLEESSSDVMDTVVQDTQF
ncbi:hypothetical protein K1719_021031 [Acacia pycnantha]|nr:hypothetical protein K1719_021031 [Acacia pycnantha]